MASLPVGEIVASVFLLLALALGGASGAGRSANAILQVAAVVAIAMMLQANAAPRSAAPRSISILAGLFALLFAVQLVPLPPALWTALPGRAIVVEGFTRLGLPLPWMPVSLAPERTLAAGLGLLVPVAMILLIGGLPRAASRVAVTALLGFVLLSVLLGVAQAGGRQELYVYTITNRDSAVGFFANANHFATLMCVAIPLAAGLVARWRRGSGGGLATRAVAIGVLLGVAAVALLGVVLTKSVAGVMLSLLALVGAGMVILSDLPRTLRLGFIGAIAALTLVVVLVAFAVPGAAGSFSVQLGQTGLSRPAMWHATLEAIGRFGATGVGFGAFPQVFPLFENPGLVGPQFANHAHNDVLELLLEGGVPAAALLVAFLIWFGRRLVAVWRGEDTLAQGASIAALIILLHSLVDYPLRTAAIGAVFGLCVALMERAATPAEAVREAAPPAGRHLSA